MNRKQTKNIQNNLDEYKLYTQESKKKLHKKATFTTIHELITSPLVAIPFIGGVSLLILSEVVSARLAFFGAMACLFGICTFATSFFMNSEKTFQKVCEKLEKDRMLSLSYQLNLLNEKLVSDRDPRDQRALKDARKLYCDYIADINNGTLGNISESMAANIENLFFAILRHLQEQHMFWKMASKLDGSLKNNFLERRENMIVQILEGVETLKSAIAQTRIISVSSSSDLTHLQNRLSAQLEVAINAVNRLQDIQDSEFNKYSEYEDSNKET